MKKKSLYQMFIIFTIVFLLEQSIVPSYAPGPKEILSHADVLREMKELPLFPDLAIGEQAAKVISTKKLEKRALIGNTPKYTQTEAFIKVWFDIKMI